MATFNPGSETLSSLFQRSDRMLEIPEFQREEIWSLSMKQRLIDSVLRGIPVPAVILSRRDTLWGTKHDIIDGQQRLRALFGFMRNEYKTSRRRLEPNTPPIEPNRFYSDLSQQAKDNFDLYPIFVMNIEGDDIDMSLAFRRWNNQKKLSFAESLYAINPDARQLAKNISDHFVFQKMHRSNDRRKPFQVLANILGIDKSDSGFVNLTHPRLEDAVYSVPEQNSAEFSELEKRLRAGLDDLARLFNGYEFTSIAEIVPMYQAIKFLRQEGFQLQSAKEGVLTLWISKHKEFAANRPFTNQTITIYRMSQTYQQRKFWEKELDAITQLVGAPRKDQRRTFTKVQKLEAYNRQNGICPICGERLSLRDDGHHMIAHANGGETDSSNCLLVHGPCHHAITAQPQLFSDDG